MRLAEAIARAQPSPRVHALIEVNLGGEASKSGVAPEKVAAIFDAAREKIEIDGLMTIPPPTRQRRGRASLLRAVARFRDRLATLSGLR